MIYILRKSAIPVIKLMLLVILNVLSLNSQIVSPKIRAVKQQHVSSGSLSLDQIYALSQEKKSAQLLTRSPSVIAQEKTDMYTQSQAHMSLPEIKNLIAVKYNTKPYDGLIKQVLDREKEYNNYYVFYHGADSGWRVAHDLYTRLYAHFKKISPEAMKDFIFLRFDKGLNDFSVNNFLITQLLTSGLINDHTLSDDILAVNLSLFGNVGTPAECTWQYFIKSRGHAVPTRSVYESIMNTFGLSHQYINELISLPELYKTKEETIIQIFVPKDRVDTIGYLAWARGVPAHQKTIDLITGMMDRKKFIQRAEALDHYTGLFKREQEYHPVFKDLIERIKSGEFSLSYFLDFYRNRPQDIAGINNFQARLVITPEVLMNPISGVKIFRYCTATSAQLQKYEQKLDMIIKKMLEK